MRTCCCVPYGERLENIILPPEHDRRPDVLHLPEDARWNAEQQAVGFGVEIGEYRGVVRVPRRVFRRLLRRTTSNGPGSKASPRGSCADAADRGWER